MISCEYISHMLLNSSIEDMKFEIVYCVLLLHTDTVNRLLILLLVLNLLQSLRFSETQLRHLFSIHLTIVHSTIQDTFVHLNVLDILIPLSGIQSINHSPHIFQVQQKIVGISRTQSKCHIISPGFLVVFPVGNPVGNDNIQILLITKPKFFTFTSNWNIKPKRTRHVRDFELGSLTTEYEKVGTVYFLTASTLLQMGTHKPNPD
ncbi:uncharacterized protein SPAPADRAFT_73218 [Spathaspora passalidarum NRRL Y-27907]|uniref:Uncharacterized protein n=1 Tax=Spathaspora passalidarum (strain NRRL Y-27907 / 11-Y1) TaxID=619300 RepID=G3AUD7_SPAPN|nr:uncharacterized protein SPAPADRAFT_73218 [Spathaspora passalidarum NRRL Y-27907]EGW30512.1 hypothetical protein SPAPADRAFT_73218 [Spathaspora passalidarum NRRL Y-27907]